MTDENMNEEQMPEDENQDEAPAETTDAPKGSRTSRTCRTTLHPR